MSPIHAGVQKYHFLSWFQGAACGDFNLLAHPGPPRPTQAQPRTDNSMTITHNLGFPRIGAKRELKFALESYWKGESSRDELKALGAQLRRRHWAAQAGLDLAPVGDFAFYDQVLDMSFTLGNLPERVQSYQGDALDNYFRV